MVFTQHVKIRNEKFGTVIFETLREKVFVTNPQGREILDLVKKNKTIEEIISALEDEYNDRTGRIRSDVTAFLTELGKQGIVGERGWL